MSNISSFKYLYSLVFKNNGDLSKVPDKVRKTPIKCYVKESHPHFLVTDDFFYIPCYFTKKAVDGFKSGSKANITDLRSKVVLITDWSLELASVNSQDVFTSYAGVELKLVVNAFKTTNDSMSLNRHPLNIYRDNEMKNLINQFVHGAMTSTVAAACKNDSLPDVSKMSGKGNVAGGVVKFGNGATFTNYGFKAGKTAVLDSNTLLKADKGTTAASKDKATKSVKPTVKGGLSVKKKTITKKSVAGVAAKIAKYTPGGKEMAKKSTSRVGPKAIATPSDGASSGKTTELKSMDQFKKLVAWHKK